MFSYGILSEKGRRKENEDAAGIEKREKSFCFALADGLGGHGGGGEASRLVVEHVLEKFKREGQVSEEYLRECFESSQELLMAEQVKQNRSSEMKTTLVILLADEKNVLWGHIGDSRLYFFTHKRYRMRTLDHSVPQMLVAAGEITEKEIRGHVDRNRLLRVMGIEWEVSRYQLAPIMEWEKPSEFLLCTDGFWELIWEKEMVQTLKKSDTPQEWLERMEEKVKKRGEKKDMDNYSAIAVFAE